MVKSTNQPVVIIPNLNGGAELLEAVESLELQTLKPYIIVVDNASRPGSVTAIAQWADGALQRLGEPRVHDKHANDYAAAWQMPGSGQIQIVSMTDNLGFAGGNNVGVRMALRDPLCKYILLLNNDTVADPQALAALRTKLDNTPEVAVCGATLIYHDESTICQGAAGTINLLTVKTDHIARGTAISELPEEADVEPRMDYVLGAAMFARASVFARTGGLSEDYFLYFEELDLSRRLLPEEKLGWAKLARVYHKVGSSIGTGSKSRPSDMSIYYDHRSKALFYLNFHKALLPFLFANLLKGILAYLRRGDIAACKAILAAGRDAFFKSPGVRPVFKPRPKTP